MATGSERSKPLHNFSLPCLKWGTQRLLRCVNADHRRSSRFQASQNSKRKIIIDDDIREEANSAAIMMMMPWNLRTRRAACKAPPPPPPPQNQDHPTRLFDIEKKKVTVATTPNNNNDKVKFSVSLSKEEVEQDFWVLLGARPPRRPKKRPRIVQRQLNTLFPGLWLAEISAESYKVADVPE